MEDHAQLLHAFPVAGEDPDSPNGDGFASSVCVNKQGNLIVVDNEASVVRIFDQTGNILASFGSKSLKSPWGVATTQSGKILVTDPGSGNLKVFSKSGKFLITSDTFHLTEPYGIAYQRQTKELTVSDKGTNCLYVHDPSGIVKDIITESDQDTSVAFPAYMCHDPAGNLYVSDFDTHLISVYDAKRQFKYLYGKPGSGDGELQNPCGVAVDSFGNILVADSGNCRVHLVDDSGKFVDYVLTLEDGLTEPQALALTQDGHLVVSEASTGLIKIYKYDHLLP